MSQYPGWDQCIAPKGKIKAGPSRVAGERRAAGPAGSTAATARESVPPPTRKRSKYGAEPTTVDGIRFASKREAARYTELKLALDCGVISDLVLQPSFALHVNGLTVCRYVADFGYTRADGKFAIEDAKGVKTAVYKLKKKMVEAEYGITVVEV